MMVKETGTGIKASRTERTSLLQWEWLRGKTITRGSISVTPVSRRVSLGLPSWIHPDRGWVFFCQRPAAFILKRGDSTETIRIHDVQQIIFFTMMGLTALWLYVLLRPNSRA